MNPGTICGEILENIFNGIAGEIPKGLKIKTRDITQNKKNFENF